MVEVLLGFTWLDFEAVINQCLDYFPQNVAGPAELRHLAVKCFVRLHAYSYGDELFEWFGLLDHLISPITCQHCITSSMIRATDFENILENAGDPPKKKPAEAG